MSEDRTRVTVNIFGTSYRFKDPSGTSREHIMRVARKVDEKMREIAEVYKSLDFPRIAVLAAVHLAEAQQRIEDELAAEKKELEQSKQEVDRNYKKMAEQLAGLEQDHRDLSAEKERMQRMLQARDEEQERLQQQLQQLQASANKEREREAEYAKLQSELGEWQTRYEQLQTEYKKLQNEYNEWIQLAEQQLRD